MEQMNMGSAGMPQDNMAKMREMMTQMRAMMDEMMAMMGEPGEQEQVSAGYAKVKGPMRGM